MFLPASPSLPPPIASTILLIPYRTSLPVTSEALQGSISSDMGIFLQRTLPQAAFGWDSRKLSTECWPSHRLLLFQATASLA